jgi:hypothetical protein
MKKSATIDLDDFEIYEKVNVRYQERYPDLKVVSVTKNHIYLPKSTVDFLRIEKDSRLVFSRRNGELYMANLPFQSQIKGYVPQFTCNSAVMPSAAVRDKTQDEIGVFCIDVATYVGGIDWYKLNTIEE